MSRPHQEIARGLEMDRNPQAGVGTAAEDARGAADAVYRSDSRHVLATLIRLLGDFDLAEEALHEAFTAALEQWPRDGLAI
jgi:DNA-directed RNA polymerase specialized sigma24 family protein